MLRSFREFEAGPDPFGQTWRVELVWLQTAVSIRHADAVDVKFFLSGGERKIEKVIALPHADLLELSRREGRPLTDPWCTELAALHLKHITESGEDMEKTLVTVSDPELEHYSAMLDEVVA